MSLAIGIGIPGAEIVLLDGESHTSPGIKLTSIFRADLCP